MAGACHTASALPTADLPWGGQLTWGGEEIIQPAIYFKFSWVYFSLHSSHQPHYHQNMSPVVQISKFEINTLILKNQCNARMLVCNRECSIVDLWVLFEKIVQCLLQVTEHYLATISTFLSQCLAPPAPEEEWGSKKSSNLSSAASVPLMIRAQPMSRPRGRRKI